MRRILSNALLAVWTAVWVAFWVVAFLLYAIVGGFGGSGTGPGWFNPLAVRFWREGEPNKDTTNRPSGNESERGDVWWRGRYFDIIIQECNYFNEGRCTLTAYTQRRGTLWPLWDSKKCHALDGKPCKWLDEVVRPLAPYGYIVRATRANAAVLEQEEAFLDYYLGNERKDKP